MDQPTRSLSAEQILSVWETGRDQHELDRALTILAAAFPKTKREALAELQLGALNLQLIRLRSLTLGPGAFAFAQCPNCSERLEFPIDTTAIEHPNGSNGGPLEFETGGTKIRFRSPTSKDLAAVVAAENSSDALRQLFRNCILEWNGRSADDPAELGPESVDAVCKAILEADPMAEISIALDCPNCAHKWETFFEIADFFWNELASQANRLLREIDALARAYGWNEREILALSARRRQTYLDLIAA